MVYEIFYTKKAIKSLKKIDYSQQKILIDWIERNLQYTNDPRKAGKPLKGKLKDYWRYRISNYRILADINDHQVQIIILNIGHRKDIYD